jgi:hypothetical protein
MKGRMYNNDLIAVDNKIHNLQVTVYDLYRP